MVICPSSIATTISSRENSLRVIAATVIRHALQGPKKRGTTPSRSVVPGDPGYVSINTWKEGDFWASDGPEFQASS